MNSGVNPLARGWCGRKLKLYEIYFDGIFVMKLSPGIFCEFIKCKNTKYITEIAKHKAILIEVVINKTPRIPT